MTMGGLIVLVALLLFLAFSIGYSLGGGFTSENPDDFLPGRAPAEKAKPTMTGK